jgi:hypothetical protein
MKKCLFALAILTLIGCQENEVAPQPMEKFVGSWSYESTELSIYFDVTIHHGIYSVTNRKVISPNIPTEQQDNNQIDIILNDAGECREIAVMSRGGVFYRIFMINNTLERDGLIVSEMQINVPGYDPLTLFNQVLKRD